MKYLLILVTTALLASSFLLPSYASQPDWQYWSEQTLKKAKQQDKLILIDLTAQWCKYCKKMEKITYQDKDVITELEQNYIAIKADEAKFPELAKRFAKVGRPGTIILDSNGKQLLAKTGYLKPQWMLWMLQGSVAETEKKHP